MTKTDWRKKCEVAGTRSWTFACWAYARLRDVFVPPDFQCDSGYQQAHQWLKGFKPKADAQDYEKVVAYAWRKFDQVNSASDTLDKKADNLMRNAGLVAGLLGLSINTLKINEPSTLFPSLAAFIFSLIFAAIACNPTGGATSASVQDVLDDFNAGHSSDAWLAASLNCVIAGRNALNSWKAVRIRIATAAFCIGLALLLLPFWSDYVTHWIV